MKLFEPVRIGEMEIRNRIVMPGMDSGQATEEGYVTEQIKAYYEERSKGGAGLIIVEFTNIAARVGPVPNTLTIDDDKFIPGLKELAQAIKKHGARAAIQLSHGGRLAPSKVTGLQPVAPSAIGVPLYDTPRELSIAEIKEVVQLFARAAKRAQKAGFDGVEIHAGHGYLISQFLSSSSNKRRDEYGGDLNNKAKFLLEVIHAVRESVGPNYPVWCRLSGEEYGMEGSITINETKEVAPLAERAGAQAIHVSSYGVASGAYLGPVTLIPNSVVPLAERVKRVVKVPVIVVGRISPSSAEKVLKGGKADLIAMGRALIADPELPNKVAAGKLGEVRPCIICLECLEHILKGEGLACTVNPFAGKEAEGKLQSAAKPKDVLVVGGGPAGMEAASVAVTRGHKVTLCERGPRLGGALVLGAILRQELEDLGKYLVTQTRSLPINIKLSTEVTPKLIEELKPQVVIVAAGGAPITPDLPGVESKKVFSIEDIYSLMGGSKRMRGGSGRKLLLWLASLSIRYFYKPPIMRWFLKFGIIFGKRVITIGGGLAGIELGAFLADRGRKVTIVEASEKAGKGLTPIVRKYFMDKVRNRGGAILTGVKCERITSKGLAITGKDGTSEELVGDTIALALGAGANSQLIEPLQSKAPEVYFIGDCVNPQTLFEAIAEGFRVGRDI